MDATLACPDNKQVTAHPQGYSQCIQSIFQKIFSRNPHKDPYIYLEGINHTDLLSILEFIYTGETKITRTSLDDFLILAQELKVQGLMQRVDENAKKTDNEKVKENQITYKEK